MSQEKLFTADEANTLIPRIELAIEKMQRIVMKIREGVESLEQGRGEPSLPQLSPAELLRLKPSLRPLFEELAQTVQEIEQHGCHFKGLELGLVDFPAEISGEIVELCWQYGEKEIAFYHRRSEGFAGRRPLNPRQQKARLYH